MYILQALVCTFIVYNVYLNATVCSFIVHNVYLYALGCSFIVHNVYPKWFSVYFYCIWCIIYRWVDKWILQMSVQVNSTSEYTSESYSVFFNFTWPPLTQLCMHFTNMTPPPPPPLLTMLPNMGKTIFEYLLA